MGKCRDVRYLKHVDNDSVMLKPDQISLGNRMKIPMKLNNPYLFTNLTETCFYNTWVSQTMNENVIFILAYSLCINIIIMITFMSRCQKVWKYNMFCI